MAKEKHYERKRKTYTFTLPDEAAEFLHGSVTNASRCIESLIVSAKTCTMPDKKAIFSKKHGPGGIRTHGHPVMSRALHH